MPTRCCPFPPAQFDLELLSSRTLTNRGSPFLILWTTDLKSYSRIVPDNARAVIATPDRYEPRANETVQDLARYYGTSVLPARPRTPRDKATAESSVQVVTRLSLIHISEPTRPY